MRRVNSRMTRKALGRYPEISLSEARITAGELLSDMARGQVPARKVVPNFAAVMQEWLARDQEGKRGIGEKLRALSFDVLPKLVHLPSDAIGRSDIRSLLDGIVARDAPVQANRVCAYLRRLFNWAVERDILDASPVEKMKAPAPEKSPDRTPTPGQLTVVWNATGKLGTPFDASFRLLVLTGQRR